MAVDKGKVLVKLNELFKGKSASKTYKENLASKLADKIETEEDIDTYVDDRADIFLESISEADRRVTEATKPKPTEPVVEPVSDDAPAWFKAHAEKTNKVIEELTGKLTGFEQQQTAKTIEQRFKSDERLKGIPEPAFKGRIPKTEEEFEAAVTELTTDYAPYINYRYLAIRQRCFIIKFPRLPLLLNIVAYFISRI